MDLERPKAVGLNIAVNWGSSLLIAAPVEAGHAIFHMLVHGCERDTIVSLISLRKKQSSTLQQRSILSSVWKGFLFNIAGLVNGKQ